MKNQHSNPLLDHLAAHHATALDEALAWLQEAYAPIGVVVSGTIVRGSAQSASDLDLVVVHDQPWRQRIQRWFNGVPCEMFVNPALQIRHQFDRDATMGRPVMAHMLATGVMVLDSTGICADLVQEAKDCLIRGPQVSPLDLLSRQYAIATQIEDAGDLRDADQARARAMAIEAVVEATKWWFLNRGLWLPRAKALFEDLEQLDRELASQVRAAISEPDAGTQLDLATSVVVELIGHSGFFAWEGDRQPVARA